MTVEILADALIIALVGVVLGLVIYAVRRRPQQHTPSMEILPTDVSVWWLDKDGTVAASYVHPRETGYAPGAATGKSIFDFFTGEAARLTKLALAHRAPQMFENEATVGAGSRHAGERRYYRVALMPQPDGRIYCSAVDITKYREEINRLRERVAVYEEDFNQFARLTARESFEAFKRNADPPLA